MPTAYEGNKPYIFISYSHADKEPLTNASMSVALMVVLATLISIIGGAINIPMDGGFFLRLLATLGLNVLPFVITGLIALFLPD